MQATFSNNRVPAPSKNKSNGEDLMYTQSVEHVAFQDVQFNQNVAEVVLHFHMGYSFRNPIRDVKLINNNASGIFFEGAAPRYDGETLTLERFTGQGNVLQSMNISGKSPTGLLAFKGMAEMKFKSFSVVIANSSINDNWGREYTEPSVSHVWSPLLVARQSVVQKLAVVGASLHAIRH